MKKINLTGLKFGRLTVLEEVLERRNRRIVWLCLCSCGNQAVITSKSLVNGDTRSCGCLHLESNIKNCAAAHTKYDRPLGSERFHQGYILIKTVDGWRKKSNVVLENFLGRRLQDDEVAHHCNRIKIDDDISNIELMLHGKHTILHNTGRNISKETRDKISQGNKKRSKIHGHRGIKLCEKDVVEIKELLSNNVSIYKIADLFKVSAGLISAIRTERIWRYAK